MAGFRRRVEYKQRWSERAARVVIAGISAVATRATEADVAYTVLALVALMAASEVVIEFVTWHRFRKRVESVAQKTTRKRALRSSGADVGHRKRKARAQPRR